MYTKPYLASSLLLTLTFGSTAAEPLNVREVFEDFDPVVYRLPEDSGNYWAIPNGDSEQYFGLACDPEATSCILAGSDMDGTDYARLQIGHDPSPDGYDNSDLAGIPTGTTRGSGDQLWCASQGYPVTMEFRVRWSADYAQSGLNDTAVGSSGFGAWNNPVLPDYTLAPTNAVFFQWVDGIGLSTVVTKAIDNQTTILSVKPVPISIDMQGWTRFKIEISRLDGSLDHIRFSIQTSGPYIPVSTVVVPGGLGCLSMEDWNDIQAYDALGMVQLQNLPLGETQELDIDWYRFSQSSSHPRGRLKKA